METSVICVETSVIWKLPETKSQEDPEQNFKICIWSRLKMDEIIKALKDKVIPPNLNIF